MVMTPLPVFAPPGGNNEQPQIEFAQAESIQARAHLAPEQDLVAGALWFMPRMPDGLVPGWPSRRRDEALRMFVMQEGNDILQGAIAGLVSRMVTFDWSISGGVKGVTYFQDILQNAELGEGWGTFISLILQDYLTCDAGAFIEIISSGDPNGPVDGPVLGIAHLDAARCQLTGNLEYPVVWNDPVDGKWHRLHTTRVARLVDMPSPSTKANGYGFCAVSRLLASSNFLTLLTGKYKPQKLSDAPPPGLLVLENLNTKQWDELKRQYEHDRRNIGADTWAGIMTMFSVDPTKPADAHMVEFAGLPDWFNFDIEVKTYVNIVALALGVDPQDIWPLSAGAMGTSMQSEILHLKARGRGIGRFIKELTRKLNRYVFPDYLEFEIGGQDIEEDRDRAEVWAIHLQNAEALQRIGLPQMRVLEKLVEWEVLDGEDLEAAEEAERIADDTSSEPENIGGSEAEAVQPPQAAPGNSPGGPPANESAAPPATEGTPDAKKALTGKASPALATLQADYEATLTDLWTRRTAGDIRRARTFVTQFKRLIGEYFPAAFLLGLRDGGKNVQRLNAEEDALLNGLITQERAFADRLQGQMQTALDAARTSPEGTEAVITAFAWRVPLWVNTLLEVYNAGVMAAAGDQMLKWKLGRRERHCESCLAANGQAHPAKTWQQAGIAPQRGVLSCGGWQCDCELKPTDEPESGSIDAIPTYGGARTRPRRTWSRLAGLLRGRR